VRVHFVGWNTKFDETIKFGELEARVRPPLPPCFRPLAAAGAQCGTQFHSPLYRRSETSAWCADLRALPEVGDRVYVLAPGTAAWLPATLTSTDAEARWLEAKVLGEHAGLQLAFEDSRVLFATVCFQELPVGF
jgi:hypothetical protein